ncbi:MAG: hypothetical protein KGJ02_03930 [Verrucomicrobiota bacterium]|nr:hypothetical protein [Verrucomicrobiota bacterium]
MEKLVEKKDLSSQEKDLLISVIKKYGEKDENTAIEEVKKALFPALAELNEEQTANIQALEGQMKLIWNEHLKDQEKGS